MDLPNKEHNFHEWYQAIIIRADMIRYYDVSGCYVLLPYSYEIWEKVQEYMNKEFNKRKIKNCYFPLLISKENLEKEEEHLEGFKQEVAWLHNKEGEPINAIRPTSESAMYGTVANLIQNSYDLPLKLNQWCNVVRLEFKHATPFIRSREFLWQEGHTAYASQQDAINEIDDIINLYKTVYEQLYAVPVIIGKKSDNEMFPGAEYTMTIESFIPETGRGLQCATAHHLGQKFSKLYDVKFQDVDTKNKFVYQNSWGLTTRSIGAMIMVHGDNKGLIIPPRVAPIQVIIIPVLFKKNREKTIEYVAETSKLLENSNIRYYVDWTEHNPGWKYNYWEFKGVPLRIEIGPRDAENMTVTFCRRDTANKYTVSRDNLVDTIENGLFAIHNNMLSNARIKIMDKIKFTDNLDNMKELIKSKNMCIAFWCHNTECEEKIKEITEAKSLCIPSDYKDVGYEDTTDEKKCIVCQKINNVILGLWGRSY